MMLMLGTRHPENAVSSKIAAHITLSQTAHTENPVDFCRTALTPPLCHSCLSAGWLSSFYSSTPSRILKFGYLLCFTTTTKTLKGLKRDREGAAPLLWLWFLSLKKYAWESTTSTIYRRFQWELPTLNRLENELAYYLTFQRSYEAYSITLLSMTRCFDWCRQMSPTALWR